MPVRLAACEPCRPSKVASDHIRLVCSRCQNSDHKEHCVHRDKSFKRIWKSDGSGEEQVQCNRKSLTLPAPPPPPSLLSSRPVTSHGPPSTDIKTTGWNYPNPGYRETSSHATIFQQLSFGHGDGDSAQKCLNLPWASSLMHRKFCRITVGHAEQVTLDSGHRWHLGSLPHGDFDYLTETRWSVMCAWLKKRILDLRKDPDEQSKARQIQWDSSKVTPGM